MTESRGGTIYIFIYKLTMASSSLTSGRNRRRRRVTLVRQPSHEDEYEGPKRFCHHRFLAPRWTAWMENNPGRRFYGCWNYLQDGGCGYFAWHDDEFGERANVVIKELLDDIDNLYDQNAQLRRRNDDGRFGEELEAIHGELRRLKGRYQNRQSEVKKWEVKFKVAFAVLIMTWVLLVCWLFM